jgi:hypothetical protein
MRLKTPFPRMLIRKAGPERRTQPRHSCAYDVPYRIDNQFGTARIRDVSIGGIGMILPGAIRPGELLTVELPDPTRNSWRLKLLRVVHAEAQSDGGWRVGSAFTKTLTADELTTILTRS